MLPRTIPPAPLPRITALLSSYVQPPSDGATWARDENDEVVLYSRASFALADAIAVNSHGHSDKSAWLPDYICEEALGPLRARVDRLNFYPITETLNPDWEWLERQGEANLKGSAFVLVHYFGAAADISPAQAFCNRRGLRLVHDAAHLLRRDSIQAADVAVFSPRKLLALPAGGCLVVRRNSDWPIRRPSAEESRFDIWTWIVKRLSQKLLRAAHIPWHFHWRAFGDPAHRRADPVKEATGLSRCARRLLRAEEGEIRAAAAARRRNYSSLLARIQRTVPGVAPVLSSAGDACPYVLPIRLPGGAAKAEEFLRKRGVPAYRWPDLPPEVLSRPDDHRLALTLYENTLLLPVHQSLVERELEFIGDVLTAFSESS